MLRELGVTVLLVGSGEPSFIQGFIEEQGLADKAATVLSDPSLALYRAAGLQRSFWSTYGPVALWGALRARGKGLSNRKRLGDNTQQGGLLLLDGSGVVRFCYRNRHLADHADTSEVVSAVMTIAASQVGNEQGRV